MYTYNTQQITRKTTSTTKTYDDDGRLICEEVVEEIEYAYVPNTTPNITPAPNIQPHITPPNTPWIVTSGSNAHHDHTYVNRFMDDPKLFETPDDGVVE